MPPRASNKVDTSEDAESTNKAGSKASLMDYFGNKTEKPEPSMSESFVSDNASITSSTKRKRDPTNTQQTLTKKPKLVKKQSSSSGTAVNNLKDSIRPGLILISIGLNPGLTTGLKGHAYAHPSNRYWPTLHLSGITPIRHYPQETHDLMDLYGLGHTNIVAHIASSQGKDLTKDDYDAGSTDLEQKIRECKPQAVMLVGKGIWEEWYRFKTGRKFNSKKDKFEYGWQDKNLWIGRERGGYEGAPTFVVTTTSALSTQHTTEQRVAIWKPMGDWFTPKREEWVKQRADEKDVDAESG